MGLTLCGHCMRLAGWGMKRNGDGHTGQREQWAGKRGILAGNWKSLIGRQVCSEARLGSARLGSAWLIIGPSCGQALGAIYLCPLSEMTAGQLWPEQGTQQATQKQQKFLPKISREAKPNWKWPELEAKGAVQSVCPVRPSVRMYMKNTYEQKMWLVNGKRMRAAAEEEEAGGRRLPGFRVKPLWLSPAADCLSRPCQFGLRLDWEGFKPESEAGGLQRLWFKQFSN